MDSPEIKILGTHNTMSYLPPKHWWGWLLQPFARCQRLTLDEQIEAGARAVDLRVWFNERTLRWGFAHGAYSLKTDLTPTDVIRSLPEGTVVRLILERKMKYPGVFISWCEAWQAAHPGLTFIGGYQKRPWIKLHTFRAEQGGDIPLHQPVGSMAEDARWYERFVPIAYARRKGRITPTEKGVTLVDFITPDNADGLA